MLLSSSSAVFEYMVKRGPELSPKLASPWGRRWPSITQMGEIGVEKAE